MPERYGQGRWSARLATVAVLGAFAASFAVPTPAAAQRRGDDQDQARRTCERQITRDRRVERRDVRVERTDVDGNALRVRGTVRQDGPDLGYTCRVSRRDPDRLLGIDYTGGNRPGRPGHRPGDDRIDTDFAEQAGRACRDHIARTYSVERDRIVIDRVRRAEGGVQVNGLYRVERGGDRMFSCIVDDDGPGRGKVLRVAG